MESLLAFSMKHGLTVDKAQQQMEAATEKLQKQFGALVRQVEWTPDRRQVHISGPGIEVEMHVDALQIHVTGDLPLISRLLGGTPIVDKVKAIVQDAFRKRIT